MTLICIFSTPIFSKESIGSENGYPGDIIFSETGFAGGSLLSEADTVNWLKKNIPEAVEELKYMEKNDPEEYFLTIQDLSMTIEYLTEIKSFSPDMYNQLVLAETLEIKSLKIARDIASTASQEDRLAKSEELKRILTEIFQIRQRERELEINQLAKEIDEMKKRVENRNLHKDKIIDRRFNELINPEYRDLDW